MSHVVSAETAATVLAVAVEAGQRVASSDVVVMLEVLTVEVPVLAGAEGTVTEIMVSAGDDVHPDEPMLIIAEES